MVNRAEVSKPPKPKHTVIFEAGGIATLLHITQRLNLLDLINEASPKREQGPTVGHYIILANLNRDLEPLSKLAMGNCYEQIVLRWLWGFDKSDFTSQRFLYPGTELVVRGVKRGTESIESRLDEAYIALLVREKVIRAQEEGFDACIIGCAGDAGVAVSKECVKIPVVGPAEAAISVFRLIGKKVVILSTIPDRIASVDNRLIGYLPRHRFVIYPSNLGVLEIRQDTAHTVDVLAGLITAAVDRDRADCAILTCAGLRGMAEQVQEKAGVPVIDPMAAAIQMAQVLVTMGQSQSRCAYPFPPEKRRVL